MSKHLNTNAQPPRVVLYIKPGCHLCEQAAADLAQLQRRQPHTLALVDITSDAELMQRYGLRIPVLAAAGREYDAPLDPAQLGRALAEAAQSTATSATTPNTTALSASPTKGSPYGD